jgi:hypothetical protein
MPNVLDSRRVSVCLLATLLVATLSIDAAFAQGPQAPPSAPVTVVNTAANPVPVRATQPLPVTGSIGLTGPVQAQQSGTWTVTAQETFAPGRLPRRYGPVDGDAGNSFVGRELVPPVAAGQTFILTHLHAVGYSNNSAYSLDRGACVLQIRVGDTYTPFLQLPLVGPGGAISGSQPAFLPLAAGEGLYVSCHGVLADGTDISQGSRVTAGGYLVPAAP